MKICGRCYAQVEKIYTTDCQEKPELLRGQPIGQYHCPDCGAMLLAGIPHFQVCSACLKDIQERYR